MLGSRRKRYIFTEARFPPPPDHNKNMEGLFELVTEADFEQMEKKRLLDLERETQEILRLHELLYGIVSDQQQPLDKAEEAVEQAVQHVQEAEYTGTDHVSTWVAPLALAASALLLPIAPPLKVLTGTGMYLCSKWYLA